MMIASLPMYDFPEVRRPVDALWRGMVRHLKREGVKNVPQQLLHNRHLNDLWSDKNLFISQCCGYDILHRYRDCLQVLGTPWFDVPGCSNGHYASIVVVPESSTHQDVIDMLGAVVVINGPESHSGMNALFSLVEPYSRKGRFFSEVKISGSHAESLDTVRRGDADVAAVDCLTYELLRRYRPTAIDGTRPLGRTFDAPAPPYVSRANVDTETVVRMQNALLATFDDPSLADTLEALLLKNVEVSSVDSYQYILTNFSHGVRAV
ncbi:PhnD/SsuA/transferrin family substrate-binding protein [Gammaproteobacteria bacterium]|nr:PhnD/SsuA/transferrin family substrate-binding protein [Gammaproteobacteria bacterium]